VEEDVLTADARADPLEVPEVVENDLQESSIPSMLCMLPPDLGSEAVVDRHLGPELQAPVREVAADEAEPAGHEHAPALQARAARKEEWRSSVSAHASRIDRRPRQ
jgi:hypothetical protein